MEYVITVLVLAALITAWAVWHARWGKARGGCGSCAALGDACCMIRQRPDLTVSTKPGPPASEDITG